MIKETTAKHKMHGRHRAITALSLLKKSKNKNTWDSNVVPHRSTNQARRCLTSQSRRDAVLSALYGPC